MARITEEKTYTLWLDDTEVNKLNTGTVFEIEFNGSRVIVKRS